MNLENFIFLRVKVYLLDEPNKFYLDFHLFLGHASTFLYGGKLPKGHF
jgi:hypothetical protein